MQIILDSEVEVEKFLAPLQDYFVAVKLVGDEDSKDYFVTKVNEDGLVLEETEDLRGTGVYLMVRLNRIESVRVY